MKVFRSQSAQIAERQWRIAIIATLVVLTILSKSLDAEILSFLHAVHAPLLTASLGWFTSFRSIIMILFIVPALFMWEGKTRVRWMLPLGVTLLATPLATLIIKALVWRERPFGVIGTFGTWDTSFPSGHTALSFAAATVLSRAFPRLAPFWYSYAILAAAGRMYLEAHYTSDVLAGAAIGLGIGWLVLSVISMPKHSTVLSTVDTDTEYEPPITSKEEYATEFRRKLLHMAVGISIVLLVRSNTLSVFDLFLILAIGILISFASTKYRIPVVHWFLEKFERKHTHPGKGAITFMVGTILCLKLFSPDIAYASIMILALGDGFSAIIGPFGSTKTILSAHKLVEGTIAGIILGCIGASFFVNPTEALLASVLAMSVEATEIKLNNKILSDNILVPLVAGTTIVLIRTFVQ